MLHQLKENGYILISSDANSSILDVAKGIGDVLKIPTMPLVQTLTPRLKEDEHESTYSGNFGVEEFPFHTDLAHWHIPPRFFLLRCVTPAPNVYTKLIDSRYLCDSLDSVLISRSHFKPRKALDRAANILKIKEGEIFRWDSIFIKPANDSAKKLSLLIQDKLNRVQAVNLSLAKKGDCLLIDNWRMVHARGPISEKEMNRKIERVYFERVII